LLPALNGTMIFTVWVGNAACANAPDTGASSEATQSRSILPNFISILMLQSITQFQPISGGGAGIRPSIEITDSRQMGHWRPAALPIDGRSAKDIMRSGDIPAIEQVSAVSENAPGTPRS
jgi:hypothetical protein